MITNRQKLSLEKQSVQTALSFSTTGVASGKVGLGDVALVSSSGPSISIPHKKGTRFGAMVLNTIEATLTHLCSTGKRYVEALELP